MPRPNPGLTVLAEEFITVFDIGYRRARPAMKEVDREILLSFWKVHILHHAGEEALHGQWILSELRRHGYEISPGTLYPLLARMERRGWLKAAKKPKRGPRSRKDYCLATEGRRVLGLVRKQLKELFDEVVADARKKRA